jgi:hypothetical protein
MGLINGENRVLSVPAFALKSHPDLKYWRELPVVFQLSNCCDIE